MRFLFVKPAHFLILFTFIFSFKLDSMEHNETNRPVPASTPTSIERITNYTRERIAGLYYATSIVGYGSQKDSVSSFLKQYFSSGWNINDFEYHQRSFPDKNEEAYKTYASIRVGFFKYATYLNLESGQTSADMDIKESLITYRYLFQKINEKVIKIIITDCQVNTKFVLPGYETLNNSNQTIDYKKNDSERWLETSLKNGELCEKIVTLSQSQLEIIQDTKLTWEQRSEKIKQIDVQIADINTEKNKVEAECSILKRNFELSMNTTYVTSGVDLSSKTLYLKGLTTLPVTFERWLKNKGFSGIF